MLISGVVIQAYNLGNDECHRQISKPISLSSDERGIMYTVTKVGRESEEARRRCYYKVTVKRWDTINIIL